MDMDR
jgi:hypothetical protein